MTTGDQILATVRRYISDLEERAEKQKALIDKLLESGRDSTQVRQTLHALTKTLALTREHLAFQLSSKRAGSAPHPPQTGPADRPM
jgi:hypothetical protein